MGCLNCEDPFKESAAISRKIENKLSLFRLANKLFNSLNLQIMKVYLAKDWRGCHVYAEPPALLKNLPSFPSTWSGHELKEFNMTGSFAEDEIPKGQYIERHIYWAMVQK